MLNAVAAVSAVLNMAETVMISGRHELPGQVAPQYLDHIPRGGWSVCSSTVGVQGSLRASVTRLWNMRSLP